jgi:hypothetical protein
VISADFAPPHSPHHCYLALPAKPKKQLIHPVADHSSKTVWHNKPFLFINCSGSFYGDGMQQVVIYKD